MFLSAIDKKQQVLGGRIREIRDILIRTSLPSPTSPGVTNGLRIPYQLRDRLIEVQSRHQMGSVKEVIFKSLVLGLLTLERLPPMVDFGIPKSPDDYYQRNGLRPLSQDEISRLRDEGFAAPREKMVDPDFD